MYSLRSATHWHLGFVRWQSISTNGGEAVLSGWRATEGTNFCAVNLRADAFGDAAFMTTMTWSPASTNAASGFQVILEGFMLPLVWGQALFQYQTAKEYRNQAM